MKHTSLALGALSATLLFTSCAAVRVTDTQVAAVVTERPRAIFIRPFSVQGAEFLGQVPGGPGERTLRQSLAPAEFSEDLKEELEKLAPARVLQCDESPTEGWLVEGAIEVVDAGRPAHRHISPLPAASAGRSYIRIHVRISEVGSRCVAAADSKDASVLARHGRVIYEFDVAGGSRGTGKFGSATAPGLGYATPFDYRNAADRIRYAIEADPHKFGARTSTAIRN